MKRSPQFIAGVLTSVIMAAFAGNAYAESTVPAASDARQAKIVDKDFGRLSADGFSAFNDVHLARIAIFDGKTDEAAKFIADAQSALAKAKTDKAVLTKAESEIKAPAKTAAATNRREKFNADRLDSNRQQYRVRRNLSADIEQGCCHRHGEEGPGKG